MKKTQNKSKNMVCQHNSHAALTIGKPYEILSEEENKVIVIDDNGEKKLIL